MMRIAFNALSVTNLSGRHVLLGHAREVIAATQGQVRHVLLYHAANCDLRESLGGAVDSIECPASTARWPARWLWESLRMPSLLRQEGVEALFSPSGMTIPGLEIPQLVLAPNPWCLVREVHVGMADHIKAWLQRLAYRRTQREATLMLYVSDYMRRIYRENAGREAIRQVVAHIGLEEATFAAASSPPGFAERRCEILAVSVMAQHKVIEDLLAALAQLRRNGIEAMLTLVGPWPDAGYRSVIEQQVVERNLTNSVVFIGYVSREEMFRHFQRARVYCLLSRSESFGIPAVEAQVFGTPVVVADCGAPPEIAGPGGVVVAPGDIDAAANALAKLLTDPAHWGQYSRLALANAQRFHWDRCSRPLIEWVVGGRRS